MSWDDGCDADEWRPPMSVGAAKRESFPSDRCVLGPLGYTGPNRLLLFIWANTSGEIKWLGIGLVVFRISGIYTTNG